LRYLLIQFLRKSGGQIDEQISVSKKIKASDLQVCNVILDYQTKKVEKCIIEGKKIDTDWDKLNEYYRNIYPSLIEQLEKNNTIKTQ
jgi:hypothetical protein